MEDLGGDYYYSHWTKRMKFTVGIKSLAEEKGAFWLIDAVASYQHQLKDIQFQLWELKVKDSKAVLTCREDLDKPNLVKQKIDYTDFPEDIKLYCIDGILLLPSEY